jgi:hypothetical protein
MDNYEAPKARRPLPTPGTQPPAPRPETPRTSSSGVPGSSFYASSKPPPLPSRPKVHGSSHTSYVAPSQDSPHYRTRLLVTLNSMSLFSFQDNFRPYIFAREFLRWSNPLGLENLMHLSYAAPFESDPLVLDLRYVGEGFSGVIDREFSVSEAVHEFLDLSQKG